MCALYRESVTHKKGKPNSESASSERAAKRCVGTARGKYICTAHSHGLILVRSAGATFPVFFLKFKITCSPRGGSNLSFPNAGVCKPEIPTNRLPKWQNCLARPLIERFGLVPDASKTGKILPILKTGNSPLEVASLRPTAVFTCAYGKL